MRHRFRTTDVFTDRIFGGNPLAVFPDAAGIAPQQMQQIAAEFNLSETAFVLPSERNDADFRVRIFTPAAELPFAGHPTIGTAVVLAAMGAAELTDGKADLVFQEGAGPVAVSVRVADDRPGFACLSAPQPAEFRTPRVSRDDLARALSLAPDELMDEPFEPQAVSCGVPMLFIGLTGRGALGRVRVDLSVCEELLADSWAPHLYCFCFEPEREGSHVRSRMFAPALGVPEDPATGSAAAPLAAYLAARDATPSGTLRWVIEQGFEMGRPSILDAEADKLDGSVTALRVGGNAVLVSDGEMTVPRRV